MPFLLAIFCQTTYLLKLFVQPQRVHNTLFIRCDKSKLTCWCLCSLHAGIQMSPDEMVCSREDMHERNESNNKSRWYNILVTFMFKFNWSLY